MCLVLVSYNDYKTGMKRDVTLECSRCGRGMGRKTREGGGITCYCNQYTCRRRSNVGLIEKKFIVSDGCCGDKGIFEVPSQSIRLNSTGTWLGISVLTSISSIVI